MIYRRRSSGGPKHAASGGVGGVGVQTMAAASDIKPGTW